MFQFLFGIFSWFGAFLRSRHDLGLELAALRQQVGVLKRKRPRPRLDRFDRFVLARNTATLPSVD